jgi:hypothetical protein
MNDKTSRADHRARRAPAVKPPRPVHTRAANARRAASGRFAARVVASRRRYRRRPKHPNRALAEFLA